SQTPLLDKRLVIRKVKGERGVEYHLKTTMPGNLLPEPLRRQFKRDDGSYCPSVSYVLIPSRERKLIKKLREELPVEYENLTVIRSSPMDKLAADLVATHGLAVLDGIKRRRINGRLRQVICGYCHTLILRGFVLNGHKVTRRKEFCSKACLMSSRR